LALIVAFLLLSPSFAPFARLASAEGFDLPVSLAQLAAMTPDGDDFPESFELRQEIAVSPREIALRTESANTAEQYDEMGYVLSYVSSYYDTASLTEVTITIDVYRDSDAAVSGFDYFIGHETADDGADNPLQGIGGSPRALRSDSSSFADGINSSDAQAAFTYGPLVANVYANSFGPSGIREDLVVSLAASLSERIEAVMDGSPVPQADLDLTNRVIHAGQATTYQEGFLSYSDFVPTWMQITRTDFEGAYFRAYDFPFPTQQGDLTVPVEGPLRADGVLFVSVATASFTTPEAAQTAHYQSGSLMLPTVLPQGTDSFRMQGEQPALVNLDEATRSKILESKATQVAILPGGPLDSVRFTVLIGNQIGIVEVAGAASLPQAREAAELILEDQVACMTWGACEPSAAIDQAPEIALETAEPVSTADDWPAELDNERVVFDTVWRTVRDQYAYRTGRENILLANYKELDWGAVREQYEPRAIEAASLGDDVAFYSTIQEMVSTLDDQHAGFRDPEATKVSRTDPEDVVYVGIGATIARSLDPNNPGLILSVYPDSPYDQAGLQRGDRILAVNGIPLNADDPETLRLIHREYVERHVPDDLGGPLELVVRKAGQRETIALSVARTSGPAEILPVIKRLETAPEIGYIQIPEFGSFNLVGQVEEGLQQLLDSDVPLSGLILDVRGNPGGYIISFQAILGHFVEGEVGKYYLRDGTAGRPLVIEPTADKAQLDNVPLVVLTDDRMYSAAEMTATILQAEGRATVVGVPSPGDVEIVTSYRLPDNSSVGVPFGIFVSPGTYVEGMGVQPDVFVGVDWTSFAPDQDPYIATAIDVLHGE
jgi:C-terminal peptidase prc